MNLVPAQLGADRPRRAVLDGDVEHPGVPLADLGGHPGDGGPLQRLPGDGVPLGRRAGRGGARVRRVPLGRRRGGRGHLRAAGRRLHGLVERKGCRETLQAVASRLELSTLLGVPSFTMF